MWQGQVKLDVTKSPIDTNEPHYGTNKYQAIKQMNSNGQWQTCLQNLKHCFWKRFISDFVQITRLLQDNKLNYSLLSPSEIRRLEIFRFMTPPDIPCWGISIKNVKKWTDLNTLNDRISIKKRDPSILTLSKFCLKRHVVEK